MIPSAISRRLLAATLLLALGSVPGCSKSSSSTAPPGPGPGTPKELNSPTLNNGQVYRDTINTAGNYGYHCLVHGTAMSGTVNVATGQASSVSISIVDNAYNPAVANVAPGGAITWTNNGSNPHTVTSN
jgi:plastocyanin